MPRRLDMFSQNQDTRAHTGDLIMSEASPDFSFLGVAAGAVNNGVATPGHNAVASLPARPI
jgi:hypothetical protein